MPNLAEIIQKIQKDLYCPICGKNYEIGEIRLKGLFDHTLIVQTICANGHMTLFMTTFHPNRERAPINANDIIDLHNALEDFNGDFQTLWNNK